MGHKSIGIKVRSAKTQEGRIALSKAWLSGWQDEQTKLLARLDLAIEIWDYDDLCVVAGQLRELTKKRFDGLYSILPIISNSETICAPDSPIYNLGKSQTGLVAALGREVYDRHVDSLKRIHNKLKVQTKEQFEKFNILISNFNEGRTA